MARFNVPEGARVTTHFASCGEQDVERAQQALGAVFPPSYREYLLDHNAISFGSVVIEASDDRDEAIPIWVLYGIDPMSTKGSYDPELFTSWIA